MNALIHGAATEPTRVVAYEVLQTLDIKAQTAIKQIANDELVFGPTELLCPALKRLLEVRRARPAHSGAQPGQDQDLLPRQNLVVRSYTHPEDAVSMGKPLNS